MKSQVVLLMIIGLLACWHTLSAQSETKDKIILKGGTVLYGTLVDYAADGTIKLIVNKKELTISGDKVKKVLMSDNSRGISRINSHNWYFRSNFGLLINDNGKGLTISQTVSYALSNWFLVGIGLGVDNYYANSGRNIMPVYAELKTYLFKRGSTPYISFRGGYGFNFRDKRSNHISTKGGVILNPSVGFQFEGRQSSWDVYLGYKSQSSQYIFTRRDALVTQEIRWHRIEAGVGLNF